MAFQEKFQEKEIEADGFKIRYWEAGQGRPVVMLDSTGWRGTIFEHMAEMSPARTALYLGAPHPVTRVDFYIDRGVDGIFTNVLRKQPAEQRPRRSRGSRLIRYFA